MGIVEDVEGWVFGIALKKGVKAIVTFLVALLTSVKVSPVLAQLGVSVDQTTLATGLTALGTGALTMGLNWVKVKTGWKWL